MLDPQMPGSEVDEAFEEFVRGRSTHLFKLALALTGWDRTSAEDVLQIAFERAYRHRRQLFKSRRRSLSPRFSRRFWRPGGSNASREHQGRTQRSARTFWPQRPLSLQSSKLSNHGHGGYGGSEVTAAATGRFL